MSNTSAAMKAAKEVQADVLAPVLYREANEWFQRAKAEYRYKNFDLAEKYAVRARHLAEKAEFQCLSNGAQREDAATDTPPPQAAPSAPYPYPTPTATPYDRAVMEQKMKNSGAPSSGSSNSDTPTSGM